jgi:hypothetical protein
MPTLSAMSFFSETKVPDPLFRDQQPFLDQLVDSLPNGHLADI